MGTLVSVIHTWGENIDGWSTEAKNTECDYTWFSCSNVCVILRMITRVLPLIKRGVAKGGLNVQYIWMN